MPEHKITCSICAWRENCKKKFSIVDPSKCIDYTRDVSIKTDEQKDNKSED